MNALKDLIISFPNCDREKRVELEAVALMM